MQLHKLFCLRWQSLLFALVLFVLLLQRSTSLQSIITTTTVTNLKTTTIPPLFDSPVFSLATCNDNNDETTTTATTTTNMNIITYACPVSFAPDRIWAIGLYKPTLSYENFVRSRTGTLQLLNIQHSILVPILGGISGRNYTKQNLCSQYGFPWINHPTVSISDEDTTTTTTNNNNIKNPMILPGCSYYIRLQCIEIIDAGGHDVAICKVLSMETTKDSNEVVDTGSTTGSNDKTSTTPYLSTAFLREQGIISNQGRVTDDVKANLLNEITSS